MLGHERNDIKMHSYVKFIILVLILLNKCTANYIPVGRTDFAAILLSNKIYFYGGWNLSVLNDLFYIDLNQSFDSSNPSFQLNFTSMQKGGHSAVTYEDEIIIFGGYNTVGNINDLVIIKEVPSNYILTITSTNSSNLSSWPSPRKWQTAVINSMKEKMYVWGGSSASGPNIDLNDGAMYIFDALSYSWNVNKVLTQPIGRQRNTATLIPDGNIIMIGGYFNLDIAQIATINGIVSARWGHTATLATNNQSIIMFGGISNSSETIDGIAVLDLTTYVWMSITPSGNPPIKTPNSHTATLHDSIIGTTSFINTVSILDISNNQYKWVNSYNPRIPNPNLNPSNPSNTPNSRNIWIIVGPVIGSVVGIGLLGIIGYLIYYTSKLKKEIRFGNSHLSANEVVDNRINVNRVADNERANNEVVF
ncbi:5440_t:CDS:2, partial [Cetraspora pellucida]